MNAIEALRLATQRNTFVRRGSWSFLGGVRPLFDQSTNVFIGYQMQRSDRRGPNEAEYAYEPSQEDIEADDWEVGTRETLHPEALV